jgi:hypothetical protein
MRNKFYYKIYTALILFLFLFLLPFSASLNAKILMTPYLQGVTSKSIYVMVETDSKNDVQVEYSKENDKNTYTAQTAFFVPVKEKSNVYVHRVLLDNLEGATRYKYEVINGNGQTYAGTFTTAPKEGGVFKFAVMGDCRSNPKIHSVISKEIRKHEPLFSIYTGDLCYDGKYNSWIKEFFVTDELALISNVPFFNSVGNHEYGTNATDAFMQAPATTNTSSKYYYSFDYGEIHFIILNSQEFLKKGSPQYDFAKDDLKNSNKKWKIAVIHQPIYCYGGHGYNSSLFDLCDNIFEPSGVNLVLSGHSHFYQRNLVNGITHLIVAGGGAPLYTPKDGNYTKKTVKEYNYGIFEASPNVLKVKIYDIYGKILDEFELTK